MPSKFPPSEIPTYTRNRAQQWIAGLRVAMEVFGTAKAYHRAMETNKIPACQLRPGDKFATNLRGCTWQVTGVTHAAKHLRVDAVSLDSGMVVSHQFTPSRLLDVR